MVDSGVVYLVLVDKHYPQKLAFVYLQEVAEAFASELQNQYGTSSGVDYMSKIECIDCSYAF